VEEDPGKTKRKLRRKLEEARREVKELGGWAAFKSGEWLLSLIQKTFRNYYERANVEYFTAKYGSRDPDFIARKLTTVAAANGAILGAVVGAAVSTNEILTIITAGGAGISLSANVGIAFTTIAAEAVLLVRMQLQLVANMAKLYGVPLDLDDPEDILTILAFAVGGSVAEAAGKAGMKVGRKFTEQAIRRHVSRHVLEGIKSVGRKLGVRILQRTILKYALPLVSMGIGSSWNYTATKAVARIAKKHLLARAADLAGA